MTNPIRNQNQGEFEHYLLDLTRVERMTGGGRRFRFRAAVIVGNRKGKVGLGVGKSLDAQKAIEKAIRKAKKNLIEVPIVEGTIPYEVEAKVGPSRILLKPQAKGRGLVAGGVVRVIARLSGIEDLSSKVLGETRNKINNALATLKALSILKEWADTLEKRKVQFQDKEKEEAVSK